MATSSRKPNSDIFVTESRDGNEFRVYPSPHIVRSDALGIQFRNFTGWGLEISFGSMPVSPNPLRLEAREIGSVQVSPKAAGGLYEYEVRVVRLEVLATGGSSPKVIIDI